MRLSEDEARKCAQVLYGKEGSAWVASGMACVGTDTGGLFGTKTVLGTGDSWETALVNAQVRAEQDRRMETLAQQLRAQLLGEAP